MLTTNKIILDKANRGHYAVGAFNVSNLEFIDAVSKAANELNSPVIIQTSESAIQYAGMDQLICMTYLKAKEYKIPISLHLDHGKDLNTIKKAIKNGFTSVMIDGSSETFDKNVKITKNVVNFASKNNVSVEGELGTIGGREDYITGKINYTDKTQAKEFIEKTGVDSLAIAIGTSHGAYKFKGIGKLDIKRLIEIKKAVKIPLVLHGASGINKSLIERAKKIGFKLDSASGVPDSEIIKAVNNGINKVNIDTDLRIGFNIGIKEYMDKNKTEIDSRKILSSGREEVYRIVKEKIKLFRH